MKERPPLLEAIERSLIWLATDSGFKPSYSMTSAIPAYEYSLDEFAALDARLAELLHTRIDRIPGQMLRLSMEYWERPDLLIEAHSPFSEEVVGTYLVHHVQSISPTVNPEYVEIRASQYELSHSESGLPYVHRTLPLLVHTRTSWLNEQYPAWLERTHVAMSLDLSPVDFTDYVLGKKIQPIKSTSWGIDHVQFD